MKILIVAPGRLPIPALRGGAIETLVTLLLDENELRNNQITFDVLNIKNEKLIYSYKNSSILEVRFSSFFERIYNTFWIAIEKLSRQKKIRHTYFIFKSKKYLKSKKYNYILVEGNVQQIQQISLYTNTKIILHLHTDLLNVNLNWSPAVIKKCYKILTVSQFIKNQILKVESTKEADIKVFKNCIDVKKFANNISIYRKYIREKYRIPGDKKILLYCGRLCKEKGIEQLLQAFSKLNNCYLVVVGASWFSDNKKGEYYARLENISRSFRERIIFTGYVTNEEVFKYYVSANVFICPSIVNEAAGLVILEARAAGIPVVATDIGGIPEYVNKATCILVKKDENFVYNLYYAINNVLNNYNNYIITEKKILEELRNFDRSCYYKTFCGIIGDLDDESWNTNVP